MSIGPDTRTGRAVQAMAGSRWFARVGPKVVPPIDRFVHRLSGGRFLLSRLMLPCAVITTTGRRSGRPRTTPLASVPLDGSLYVVGSNFGRPEHPAWTWNLLATPRATVSFDGEEYDAEAVLLSTEDKERVWPRLVEQWPLFGPLRLAQRSRPAGLRALASLSEPYPEGHRSGGSVSNSARSCSDSLGLNSSASQSSCTSCATARKSSPVASPPVTRRR